MTKLTVNPQHKKSKISKEIYGHFSEHLGRCIYEGVFVGEDSSIPNENGMRRDVVEALRQIRVPVLRWPGGCFADEYHWKDGVGPREKRKKMINTHWGGVVEDNRFGTHEFMELCRQLGCEAYVNGNLGSGTVQEMSEWVEYMTSGQVSPMSEWRKENGHAEPWKVQYFGVGNENWGCGGSMLPEYYANEYRRYQTYVRNYHDDWKIKKIACGAGDADYEWTRKVLEVCSAGRGGKASNLMDGISLHYYTVPGSWEDKGSATDFTGDEYYRTVKKALYMEELLRVHGAILDAYDPEKKIGLVVDEWGTWYNVEPGTPEGFLYQQNTMRDAMVAALTLNLFNEHSDRVRMANLAQLVNVLQSVLLTEGDRMVKTPTYHVFDLYKEHQGNTLLDLVTKTQDIGEGENRVPQVSASASMAADGTIHITAANLSLTGEEELEIAFCGQQVVAAEGPLLAGEVHAHNTFEAPETVKTAVLSGIEREGNTLRIGLPPTSVVHLRVETK